MTIDLSQTFIALARAVERLEELDQWEKLAQQELRSNEPPCLRFLHHFDEDERELHGRFCMLKQTMRQSLIDPNLVASPENLQRWKQELRELEQRVYHLHLGERLK